MKRDLYNKKYFEERNILDLRIAYAIKIFMLDHNLKSILDVGCGTGQLVKFLNENGLSALGSDNSAIAVNAAKKINKKNSIYKASAIKLPFKDNAFDLITCISTIEHLTMKSVDLFLKEANRIIKPDGFIFLVTPNFASPFRYILQKKWFGYSDPTHITFFTPFSLAKKLRSYDFMYPQYWFKTNMNLLIFLLFSTPLCFIRDSFWISAKKQ